MPLQNRVTPFGEIVALLGRGTLTGNRGILHGDHRNIVRASQVRRWIACVLEYRGIRRTVMTPHRWTELFFLDEATALSAGHRPCAECRRPDFRRFQTLWQLRFGGKANADAIDGQLAAERGRARSKRTYRAELSRLPDGTFVAIDRAAWLVWRKELLLWTDSGYTQRRARENGVVDVLTPPSIVALIADGYTPLVHPSA